MAIEVLAGTLRDHTTLQVGGGAQLIVRVTTDQELIDLVRNIDQRDERLLILGGGSNVVCTDQDFPGTVIVIAVRGIDWDEDSVTVAAGENWDAFVSDAIDLGFGGLAPLSGIPGSMGATPIQNIGAYGVELAEFIEQVSVWDRQDNVRRNLSVAECRFDYRDSALKKNPSRYVVLSVTLQIPRSLKIPIRYEQLADVMNQEIETVAHAVEVRDQVLRLRGMKSMVLDSADADSNSTGSFFINPTVLHVNAPQGCPTYLLKDSNPLAGASVKLSAAWLIEKSGITKGFGLADRDSRIRVSRNHTLAIANADSGSSREVIELASYIRQQVFNSFGIELMVEPVLINCELDQLTHV
jgi:UDP-N-acetylmuramate dehydrogenase